MPETANAIHMPSNWDPMAYDFVDAFDNMAGDPGARGARQADEFTYYGVTVRAYSPAGAMKCALLTLLAMSPTSRYQKDRGQQCDHCGAHLRYVCVLEHRPSGNHIAVGETCLDNRVGSMTQATWKIKELREAAARARQADRNRAGKLAVFAAHPGLSEIFDKAAAGHYAEVHPYADRTIRDIASRYPWSDRQIEFVLKLDAEYDAKLIESQARDARRAREAAQEVVEAPTGRVGIRGTIVFTKWQEGDWGMVQKMLVRCEVGEAVYKVWMSAPSDLSFERFDIIEAKVTLKHSDRDSSFAFGSRPSNARIVGHNDNVAPEDMSDSMAPMVGE